MVTKVVLIMGYPAAGKTIQSDRYQQQGYVHLNRDKAGGTILDLIPRLDGALSSGQNVVIDNTMPTAEIRKPFIQVASKHKVKIECIFIDTSFEDAQLNACLRLVRKYGRIPEPKEFSKLSDPNAFPPVVIYQYRKELQKPKTDEGFEKVTRIPFERKWSDEYCNEAIIFDYDGTLRINSGESAWPTDPNTISLLPGVKEKISSLSRSSILLGASNQSACAKGLDRHVVEACFKKTNQLIDRDIDFAYCPHQSAPPICWCRKPSPGMAAYFIEKYKLNPAKCLMIGDMTSDKTFASRAGFRFMYPEQFFGA